METSNATTTTTLTVGGMTCGHCVRSVKAALEAIAGVTKAEVSLEAGRATVEHDRTVDVPSLASAVNAAGYQAEASATGTGGGSCGCSCCKD